MNRSRHHASQSDHLLTGAGPAQSDEQAQLNAAGQVELKLKTSWRDGSMHLVMSPLELMQRLAALVPRPMLQLIRFHGALAPNAKLRSLVVPQGPPADREPVTEAAAAVQREVETAQVRSGRASRRCASLPEPLALSDTYRSGFLLAQIRSVFGRLSLERR